MGTCIICGASVDGEVCTLHEEDVAFEFRGNRPDQLTPNRYYQGEVDGFAEFGVFVELGSGVTGLLHESKLPRRLESLDWKPGETVYVQVLGIHDNGNVDLGWSIRSSADEFRGQLIDRPSGDARYDEPSDDGSSTSERGDESAGSTSATTDDTTTDDVTTDVTTTSGATTDTGSTDAGSTDTSATESEATESEATESDAGGDSAGGAVASQPRPHGGGAGQQAVAQSQQRRERIAVDSLADRIGSVVRLEGEITGVRQTPGPTVFELSDETGAVECAAFEEAGVRAYPEVEVGDVVRLTGEVERRRGNVQVETAALKILADEEREAVEERLADALEARVRPERTDLLADDPAVEAVDDDLVAAATAIRRAVVQNRPVVVHHPATVGGYVAGAAIELAVLPLVRDQHDRDDAVYHYVDRKPLDDTTYDMNDATGDVTRFLEAADRHDEKRPFFVFAGAGGTEESIDGFRLLDIYDAGRVVVTDGVADEAVADAVEALVNPARRDADGSETTAAVLAANLAAIVNDDVRDDLRHLPAISYWSDPPAVYRDLATEAGVDEDTVRELREAIALEAFYQSYEDKRELIRDLLWGDATGTLSAHVSGQFREKLETEVETARHHVEERDAGGVALAVLDVAAFTHRYDFPPADVLLAELHRRRVDDGDGGPTVTLGVGEDELRLQSTGPVDARDVADAVDRAVPDAGATSCGGLSGRIEFLVGERDAVVEAAIDAIAEQF